MATRLAPTRARFQRVEDEGPRPKRRKVGKSQPRLEVVAPEATLPGLPDNILLTVMGLLDVHSLIRLSRVCRRLHQLHGDESIWSDVEILLGARLNSQKLKKIIHTYLPSSLWRIKLCSNAQSSRKPLVTEAVVNELFIQCPIIRIIVLHRCDLAVFSSECKLFHCSSLESVSLISCSTSYQWMENIKPWWPNLRYLSLSDTVKTSDFDLKYIGQCEDWSVSIESLILHGCYRVSNKGIQYVGKGLKNLKKLDVTNCPQLSLDGLDVGNHIQLIHS